MTFLISDFPIGLGQRFSVSFPCWFLNFLLFFLYMQAWENKMGALDHIFKVSSASTLSWSYWLTTPEALLRCSSPVWLLETSIFSNTLIYWQFILSFPFLRITCYFKHKAGLVFTICHSPTGCSKEGFLVGDIHGHLPFSDIFVKVWKKCLQ